MDSSNDHDSLQSAATLASTDGQSRLVDDIYNVVIDQNRLDELFLDWGASLGSLHESFESAFKNPAVQNHLRRASDLFDQNTRSAERPEAHSLSPVMAFNLHGELLSANPAAQLRYGIKVGDSLSDLGLSDDTEQQLRVCIDRASAIPVVLSSASQDEDSPTAVPAVVVQRPDSGNRGDEVQLSTNEIIWPDELNRLLNATFALTTAELDVLESLVKGLSVNAVAEQRGSSVATVRAQIRAIYGKTRVRNQSELTRLALSFAPLAWTLPAAEFQNTGESSMFPKHFREFQLRNGRIMAFAEVGAPDGIAVVFLHDEYYGAAFSPKMVESISRHNLRIIIPARPYFGASNGEKSTTDVPGRCSEDLLELLEFLNIRQYGILSRRTGYRYGLYLMHRQPSAVLGMVALEPALPVTGVEHYSRMWGSARLLSAASFNNPVLTGFIARSGYRYLQTCGKKRFVRMLNRGCEADLQVLENPQHWRLIEQGLEFGSHYGHRAFLHDVNHDPKDVWQKAVTAPIHIRCLIGELDPNDRTGRAQRLIAAGSDLSVRHITKCGQLFFYDHFDLVLDELNERLQLR